MDFEENQKHITKEKGKVIVVASTVSFLPSTEISSPLIHSLILTIPNSAMLTHLPLASEHTNEKDTFPVNGEL